MNFDTLSIECFLAVADTQSFTKAAQRVNRTQSAVSQQIAKLETLLGKPLFSRAKNVALTADGELFLSYAKQMYALQRETLDRFREPELEGEVRFGLPEDFASVFLSDVLTDFTEIHPRIQLHIECDFTINLYQRFKKSEFDLVLVKMSRPEDFPNGIDVWSEPLEWVGSRDIALDSPIPLILSPSPCVYRSRAIEALNLAKRPWRIAFTSSSYTVTIAAVNAGMGITVLPRNMIPRGLLPIRREKQLPRLDDTHISLLKQSGSNPAINSFESFVMQRLI